MKVVTIQTLKPHLSSVLAEVESGATIEITRHGRPIARLGPVDPPHLHRGREVGTYVWPPAVTTGLGKRALEVLLEDRGDR